MNKKPQNGNAIVMILIAIALFAALGYAFSSSTRTSTSFISDEEAKSQATHIIAYGNDVKSVVKRLRLQGCSDTEISFENSTVAGYTNANAPGDNSCHVFDPSGGAMTYTAPLEIWLDPASSAHGNYGKLHFSGRVCVDSLPDGDWTTCFSDGIDNEELIFFQPFIQKRICLAINDKLGITNPSGDAPLDSGCSMPTNFVGSYGDNLAIGNATKELDGKTSGCYRHDAGCVPTPNSYNFYQVLIIR